MRLAVPLLAAGLFVVFVLTAEERIIAAVVPGVDPGWEPELGDRQGLFFALDQPHGVAAMQRVDECQQSIQHPG